MVGAPQLVRGAEAPERGDLGRDRLRRQGAAAACSPRRVGEALTLGAFELSPGAPAGPVKTIAALTGATQDASPVFSGPGATSLFFADDAVGGTGRVRWMADRLALRRIPSKRTAARPGKRCISTPLAGPEAAR